MRMKCLSWGVLGGLAVSLHSLGSANGVLLLVAYTLSVAKKIICVGNFVTMVGEMVM